jgi:hypothetical protein
MSLSPFKIKATPDLLASKDLWDPTIETFSNRVKLLPDARFLRDVYEEIGNEPKTTRKLVALVEVSKTDGRTFNELREYAKGDPWYDSTRWSVEDLAISGENASHG